MKEFEVKGRNSHPRTEGNDYSKTLNSTQWQMLGKFNASNTKGVQVFCCLHSSRSRLRVGKGLCESMPFGDCPHQLCYLHTEGVVLTMCY